MTPTRVGSPMTRSQRRVLGFIADFLAEHGYAPSLDDIRLRFRFASINAGRDHLVALERKGLVTRQRRVARSLTLTPLALETLARFGTSIDSARTGLPGNELAPMPACPEKENEP